MITNDIDYPKKKADISPKWSLKKLLSLDGGTVGKMLVGMNPFESGFFLALLLTGFGELFGGEFSIAWYVIVFLVFGAALFSQKKVEPEIKKEEKEEKK